MTVGVTFFTTLEVIMAFMKNVATGEKVIRIIIGIILVVWGASLDGFWRPASIVVGCVVLVTAFAGY